MKISKLTRETFNLKKKEALITQALCDAARNGIDDSEIIFKSAIENNNCLSIEACLHELALEERDLISFGTAISAARRGSEIIDSHRLCAAVLFINTPNMHSTKKELSKETIDHLKKINIFCSNKLFKFEQLYNLSYNSRLNLHINLIKNNEIIPDYDFDIPDVGPWCGVRIIVFSIKGKKDFWDENSKENIQLALASVLEILAKEKYITPTLTNTFGKALDQADESMLPISFLISAAQASNLSFSNINDLAFSISFHRSDTNNSAEILKVAVRSKKNGFFINGFETKISTTIEKTIQLCATLVANTGCNTMYVIEDVMENKKCPICNESIYPMPDIDEWIKNAQDSLMPIDGSHKH